MKETTGELNATVAVMLAIGVLIAFFYYTLWPLIKNNFDKNSQCSKAICEKCDLNGDGKADVGCETVTCYPKGEEHQPGVNDFQCVYKG